MKQKTKKKKKTMPTSKPVTGKVGAEQKDEKHTAVSALTDAFSSASLNDDESAGRDSITDPRIGSEMLRVGVVDNTSDPSTSSCSSGISGSSWSAGSSEDAYESSYVLDLDALNGKGIRKNKHKRVVAATGTVSTVLGKEYSIATPKKNPKTKLMGFAANEETEQFLYSMLGENCELSMAVVRDVLCQCGNDVEKALDALLELSDLSNGKTDASRYSIQAVNFMDDIGCMNEQNDSSTYRAADCTSNSFVNEFEEGIWSLSSDCRNYASVLASSESQTPASLRSIESHLPQKVLESLFNISTSPEYEPSTMNWRNIVKKMQSMGPSFDDCASSTVELHSDTCAKGDEYQVYRKTATQHWDLQKTYYQRAAAAFSHGEWSYASYLSDQGKVQTQLAQKADEKASKNIFKARNKGIENVITIDLHGQHVKQAIRLLKVHLLFGTYVPSIQTLRVITGCGSHGLGKSKVKQSVTKLLEKEGVEWTEENRGTLLIKLGEPREFNFLDDDSDTE